MMLNICALLSICAQDQVLADLITLCIWYPLVGWFVVWFLFCSVYLAYE